VSFVGGRVERRLPGERVAGGDVLHAPLGGHDRFASGLGSRSPRIRSMTATGFLILAHSRTSIRRLVPQLKQVISRGRDCALATPTCPHLHAIMRSIGEAITKRWSSVTKPPLPRLVPEPKQ
jgi:hypothetical protein